MQLYDFNIRYIILTMMRFKNGKRRNNLIYDKYHQEKLEEEIKQLKEQLQQEKEQNNELEKYLRIVEQKNREFYKQQFEKELYYTEGLEEEIKERYKDLYEQNKKLVNQNIRNELNKKYHIQAIIELNKQIKVLKNELKKIKQEKKYLEDNYDDIVELAKKQVENIEKENDDAVEEYKEVAMNNHQELEKQIQENNKLYDELQKLKQWKEKMKKEYFFFPKIKPKIKLKQPVLAKLHNSKMFFKLPSLPQKKYLYYFNNPKYEEYINLNNIAKTANKKYK